MRLLKAAVENGFQRGRVTTQYGHSCRKSPVWVENGFQRGRVTTKKQTRPFHNHLVENGFQRGRVTTLRIRNQPACWKVTVENGFQRGRVTTEVKALAASAITLSKMASNVEGLRHAPAPSRQAWFPSKMASNVEGLRLITFWVYDGEKSVENGFQRGRVTTSGLGGRCPSR